MPETEAPQSTVLCVERNPDERELLRTWFMVEGYRVLTASTPQEALSILKQEYVDICLIDEHLPVMDGLDLCKTVRAEWKNIGIILTSTDSRPYKLTEPLAAGANRVITKPIDWVFLFASIRTVLTHKKTASERNTTRRFEPI